MLHRFLRHNAVALLALAVALGGTSYAAVKLPRASVGTAQLRADAVTKAKLADKAVGQANLDSELVAAIKQLGAAPRIVARTGQITPIAVGPGADPVAAGGADCQPGEQAVSGGYTFYPRDVHVTTSGPSPDFEGDSQGWHVELSGAANGTVVVLCTPR